jgi:mono/diheme cytochrome c family protein
MKLAMTRAVMILLCTLIGGEIAGGASDFTADSARGAQLFETLSCVQCHTVNGRGGSIGPDLGRIVDRGFTPSTLAATMWNHAPEMWASMHQQGIRAGDLNEQAAADLFAYFYSTRFFELPGDAARGKRAFTTRGCSNCHGLQQGLSPGVKPVSQWDSLMDPIALTDAMWNHAPRMLAEIQRKQVAWPVLKAQELTDILVYLRNLPFPASKPSAFQIGAGNNGDAIFLAKGCAGCHPSISQLGAGMRGKTLTEVAAAMWNHLPILLKEGVTPPPFAPGEMKDLLGNLWAQPFFEDAGKAPAGRRVFVSKKCASCHEGTAAKAPTLAGTEVFNGATMVSALWRHGPSMLSQMSGQGVPWPRFDGSQMADLIAYLNAKR